MASCRRRHRANIALADFYCETRLKISLQRRLLRVWHKESRSRRASRVLRLHFLMQRWIFHMRKRVEQRVWHEMARLFYRKLTYRRALTKWRQLSRLGEGDEQVSLIETQRKRRLLDVWYSALNASRLVRAFAKIRGRVIKKGLMVQKFRKHHRFRDHLELMAGCDVCRSA